MCLLLPSGAETHYKTHTQRQDFGNEFPRRGDPADGDRCSKNTWGLYEDIMRLVLRDAFNENLRLNMIFY